MNIIGGPNSPYREFLNSPAVEEFIHAIFSLKGRRGTSMLTALRELFEYRTPGAASVFGNNSSRSPHSFGMGASTSGSEKSPDSDHMSRKRKRLMGSSSSEDECMNVGANKIRRRETAEGLGRRLACPLAKGDPAKHPSCSRINRQNLAGIKEHLKRTHHKGTLPGDIKAVKTWFAVFDILFPQWGGPRPSPYCDVNDACYGVNQSTGEHAPVEDLTKNIQTGWPRTGISQMEECQDILGDTGNMSIVPSPRMSPNLANTLLGQTFIPSPSFAGYERPPYENPKLSAPSQSQPNTKIYTLMIARLPATSSSVEAAGPKRFSFDNFWEFRHQFDRWIRSQFTDPPFSWDRWELLNQFTTARLKDLQSVVDDIDFSFVAQNSTRAALYLVARAEF
ncbi:hypothetical protein TWF718_010233 [Orbilia javanica]|uniref:Uncharacterized protein n=1 Tax=Orbilia javanica TaxID=47235 RepID=A0AAN8MXE5_9PEZI